LARLWAGEGSKGRYINFGVNFGLRNCKVSKYLEIKQDFRETWECMHDDQTRILRFRPFSSAFLAVDVNSLDLRGVLDGEYTFSEHEVSIYPVGKRRIRV